MDIVLRQLLQFAIIVALARLLSPADFGLVAIITFFASLSTAVVQAGIATALLQRAEGCDAQDSGAFWLGVAVSFCFALAFVALGPALAAFFEQPALSALVWVAAVQVLATGLGAAHVARLTRALRIRPLATAGIAATLVAGAGAITAAMLGAGVWALAIQFAGTPVLNTLFVWCLEPWRPQLRVTRSTVSPLLGSSAYLSSAALLEVLYSQGFAILLGRKYGAPEVGFYSRALSTQMVPATIATGIVGRLALPLFVRQKDDPAALRGSLQAALRLLMLFNIPISVGLIITADLVITTIFGPAWLPAAPLMAILCIAGLLMPLHLLNLQVVLAMGWSRVYFRVEVQKKILGIAGILVGSLFGITGVAVGQALLFVLAVPINTAPAARASGYTMAQQFRDMADLFIAASLMAAAVLLLRPVVEPLAAPVQLLILAGAGAGVYFLVGLAFRMPSFVHLRDEVRMLRGGLAPEQPR